MSTMVIIAESSLDDAERLGSRLAGEGYDVELFSSGEEAISAALRNRPAVIIWEADLPDLPADKALNRLSSEMPLAEVVVAISGADLSLELLQRFPFALFFAKPLETDRIADFLRRIVPLPQDLIPIASASENLRRALVCERCSAELGRAEGSGSDGQVFLAVESKGRVDIRPLTCRTLEKPGAEPEGVQWKHNCQTTANMDR